MATEEVGKIARTDRGVKYARQIDGSWSKTIQAAFVPIGLHNDLYAEEGGLDLSLALVLAPPPDADKILVQALAQNVRYTLDGTDPSATVGFQLAAGDPPLVIPLAAETVLKVIEETAGADLQFQWGS